jgi:hypothetical protein
MDKPHKQVITTNPVAIKSKQGRVHIKSEHPWHRHGEAVKCPDCEVVFDVACELPGPFPTAQLLDMLKKQHADGQAHPDVISYEPAFTRITECDCGDTPPKTA